MASTRKNTTKQKKLLKELVYIFIGSGLGGLTRFGFGKWISSFHSNNFPFGTFIVNILACLIMGFVVGLADDRQLISPRTRLFWIVGFCGGFSTFSTFSNETRLLLHNNNYSSGIFYVFASIVSCLLAIQAGLFLSNKI